MLLFLSLIQLFERTAILAFHLQSGDHLFQSLSLMLEPFSVPTQQAQASSSNVGPSLFGGPGPAPTQQAQASSSNVGPSLFGGPGPAPTQQAQTSNSNVGPSLFGGPGPAPTQQAQASSSNVGPSLFGGPGLAPTQQAQASNSNVGPSLFGGPSLAPTQQAKASSSNVGPTLLGVTDLLPVQQALPSYRSAPDVPAPPSIPTRERKAKVSMPKSYRRADANVILLSLGTLKNDPVIMTGDPVHCSQCKVHLSHVSRLETAEEEGQRNWTW